jgi:hypothetical protein
MAPKPMKPTLPAIFLPLVSYGATVAEDVG